MQNFTFKCPTDIVFGKDAELQVGKKIKEYGGSHVFIVYGGGSVVRTGLLSRVERVLTESGIAFTVRGGVKPNPLVSHARDGVREAISFGADFILAVGGGSVIDTAKAIAHGVANPETDIWDFWCGRAKLTKSMPVAVVLTLAAAGSETSDSAVLTNEEMGVKGGINTPFNRPTLAFMNPELTYTVPKKQLVAGVSDILMHTLERYFTKFSGNELTDLVAEALIKDVVKSARVAVKDQRSYDAMSEIMWCGSVSHSNFTELGRCKDFSCHKLGHALSAKFDTTHGESLTAIWGSWAEYVYHDDTARFAHFAEKVWDVPADFGDDEAKAKEGIRRQIAFFTELGMPTSLGQLDSGVLKESTIKDLADQVTAKGTKTVGNFHPIDWKAAVDIYTMANH